MKKRRTVVGFMPPWVDDDLEDSYYIHGSQSSVKWLTDTEEVHDNETRRFSLQENGGQKKL